MTFDHLDDDPFEPDQGFRDRVAARADQLARRRRAMLTLAVLAPLVTVGAIATVMSVGNGDPEELSLADTDPITSSPSTSTIPPTTVPPTTISPPGIASSTSLAPSSTPSTAAAPTTEAIDPSNTTSPPTTPAPPTTAPDPAAGFVLRADGLGSVAFGDAATDVVDALTPAFGAPVLDESMSYPNPDPVWGHTNDGGQAFVQPFGRTVCFIDEMCTYYGGIDPTALAFVGWSVRTAHWPGDPAWTPGSLGLSTTSGVSIGSALSDHLDVIEVSPFGCFSAGYGTVDGVRASLYATDGWFVTNEDQDPAVPSPPDPVSVTVYALAAGSIPAEMADDC